MSQLDAIRGRIEGLREELDQINPAHPWNRQRIADRQRGIELCQAQLDRIERGHQSFLNRRAELVARYIDFARKGGR
jgi:chromosome segregation ATPase